MPSPRRCQSAPPTDAKYAYAQIAGSVLVELPGAVHYCVDTNWASSRLLVHLKEYLICPSTPLLGSLGG